MTKASWQRGENRKCVKQCRMRLEGRLRGSHWAREGVLVELREEVGFGLDQSNKRDRKAAVARYCRKACRGLLQKDR